MTTEEKVIIVIGGVVLIGGVYWYMNQQKAAAAAAQAAALAAQQQQQQQQPPAPSDELVTAFQPYAVSPLDLQYLAQAAKIIENAPGFQNDWGQWWFADLSLYTPTGSKNNFVKPNSVGKVTATNRLATSTNELATNANWQSLKGSPSAPDTQLYNLVQQLNSKMALGLTS